MMPSFQALDRGQKRVLPGHVGKWKNTGALATTSVPAKGRQVGPSRGGGATERSVAAQAAAALTGRMSMLRLYL